MQTVDRGALKCRISWCHDPADSEDGWCWTHLVMAFVNHVPVPAKDRERVEQALRKDREEEARCRRGWW